MSQLSQPGVISVCNEALAAIGAQRINAIDEQSQAAAACNDRYADAVRATLRDHPWVSAAVRVSLPKLESEPAHGGGNLFQLPADFVRMIETYPRGLLYEINGRTATANVSILNIRYVSSATPASQWDPLLRKAVAMQLAMAIAPRFGVEKPQIMASMYRDTLAAARHASGSERSQETGPQEDWIGVRGSPDDPRGRGIDASAEPFGPFAGDWSS